VNKFKRFITRLRVKFFLALAWIIVLFQALAAIFEKEKEKDDE